MDNRIDARDLLLMRLAQSLGNVEGNGRSSYSQICGKLRGKLELGPAHGAGLASWTHDDGAYIFDM